MTKPRANYWMTDMTEQEWNDKVVRLEADIRKLVRQINETEAALTELQERLSEQRIKCNNFGRDYEQVAEDKRQMIQWMKNYYPSVDLLNKRYSAWQIFQESNPQVKE